MNFFQKYDGIPWNLRTKTFVFTFHTSNLYSGWEAFRKLEADCFQSTAAAKKAYYWCSTLFFKSSSCPSTMTCGPDLLWCKQVLKMPNSQAAILGSKYFKNVHSQTFWCEVFHDPFKVSFGDPWRSTWPVGVSFDLTNWNENNPCILTIPPYLPCCWLLALKYLKVTWEDKVSAHHPVKTEGGGPKMDEVSAKCQLV